MCINICCCRSEATAMVSFYSVYLLIMYFNPNIEAYLYKVTKTKTPEFKSDLHEQQVKNGKNASYEPLYEKQDKETEGSSDDEGNDKEKVYGKCWIDGSTKELQMKWC